MIKVWGLITTFNLPCPLRFILRSMSRSQLGLLVNWAACFTKASWIFSYPQINTTRYGPIYKRNTSPYFLCMDMSFTCLFLPILMNWIRFPTRGRANGPGMSVDGVQFRKRRLKNTTIKTRTVVKSTRLIADTEDNFTHCAASIIDPKNIVRAFFVGLFPQGD